MPGILVVANGDIDFDVDYFKHNTKLEYGTDKDWFFSKCDEQVDRVKEHFTMAIVIGECLFVTKDMFDRVVYVDEDGDYTEETLAILEAQQETDTPEDQGVEGLET